MTNSPAAAAREKQRFALIAAAGFVAAALTTAPASAGAWMLKRFFPLASIASAEGTIWKGKFSGVTYNGILIGDVDYRLRALPLLLARADLDARSAGGALLGRARLKFGFGSIDLSGVSAEFNLGAVRRYTFFGVRYQGSARLDAERLRLTRSGCVATRATLSTTAFEALSTQWSGGPFPVSGAITCRGGELLAALSGKGDAGSAAINISVKPDFAYSIRVAAEPRGQELSRTLEHFGFEKNGTSLSYEAVGVLKGLSS